MDIIAQVYNPLLRPKYGLSTNGISMNIDTFPYLLRYLKMLLDTTLTEEARVDCALLTRKEQGLIKRLVRAHNKILDITSFINREVVRN